MHTLTVAPGFAAHAGLVCLITGFLHNVSRFTVSTICLGLLHWSSFPDKVPQAFTALLVLPILLVYYKLFLKPLEIVNDPESTRRTARGIGRRSRHGADGIRTTKNPGATPPPYPNGWYRVVDSTEVKPGTTKHVSMLGRQLVVYRGMDGKAAVLDAYCPHLGADLSGGTVIGNELRCPFHGWTFGADGQVTKIPYCDTVPKFAKTASWPIEEANGFIYMWFDAEGREPSWHPPHIEGVDSGEWSYHGRAIHYAHCHIAEIPENGADIAHLPVLHEKCIFPILSPVVGHGWSATWERNQELSHETLVNVKHDLEVYGHRFTSIGVTVSIRQVGPSIVFLKADVPFLGQMIVSQSVVPLKPLFQQSTYHVYASPAIPRFLAKMFLWSIVQQFERDIEVWNDKTYIVKPMLVKGDGNILGFRRWFQQFYSESSDKLTDVASVVDW
eukprot:TRINITY_DN1202_c0_g1_i4.p1 TRINITY_DN1202_c0_g1~~TRINITY_DN1202_c0_g1_i4.p1  ORF type:complete len:443 (-),score=41.87 TRINITY_DN1202_c0_g1_i4:405-1733(-)